MSVLIERQETEPKRKPASPWKVYPAWGEAFDEEWDAPLCTECGAIAPRDGLHLCEACRRWA